VRSLPPYEAAHSANGMPYVRIGEGKDTLVIFTSGSPDMSVPQGFMLRQFVDGARNFAEQYTVYFVKRKRGLIPGYTTQQMADDYAIFINQEIGKPCHILGISTGGFIAEHFAATYPLLVRRLVITIAGYQLQGDGRQRVINWCTYTQNRQYRKLLSSMYTAASDTPLTRFAVSLLAQVIGTLLPAPQADLDDFAVLLDALLAHDGRPSLPKITCPALIIGGKLDVFYPPAMLDEMAQLIPNARLSIYPGVGHGLVELRKKQFEKDVLEFLNK
jgi:pimeloyl-ACP methyl ester carboxylesterase